MLKPETKTIQSDLATYCRTGIKTSIKGVREDRLHHYRRLVYNITYGILKQAYPITYKVLTSNEWNLFIEEFFAKFPCSDPQVWKMPYDLYLFAKQEDYAQKLSKPFLLDLLLLEWTEIEIHSAVDINLNSLPKPENELMVNPYLKVLELSYPVHKVKATELLENKAQYYVVCYRIQSGVVKFLELSPFLHAVFSSISLDQSLDEIVDMADKATPDSIAKQQLSIKIKEFIESLKNKEIIL